MAKAPLLSSLSKLSWKNHLVTKALWLAADILMKGTRGSEVLPWRNFSLLNIESLSGKQSQSSSCSAHHFINAGGAKSLKGRLPSDESLACPGLHQVSTGKSIRCGLVKLVLCLSVKSIIPPYYMITNQLLK